MASSSLEPLELPEWTTEGAYGVFDLETLAPSNEKVWAVGYRDERGYRRFDNPVTGDNGVVFSRPHNPEDPSGPLSAFLRAVFADAPRILYAHNGGNFDHQYVARWLLEHAETLRLSVQIIPLSSSIMAMLVKDARGGEWKILDSMRILPMSLDKVAATFGLEGKLDHGKRDESYYANLHKNPDRYKYLSQDVHILDAAIRKYREIIKGFGSQTVISAASTAMKLYRSNFQPGPITINRHWEGCDLPEGPGEGHCVGCAHDFFRDAYYGGRVEPFFVAPFESPVDVFYGDINSMYPHAMLGPMPTGAMRRSLDIDGGRPNEVGFFHARVSIPSDCKVPPLPFRSKGLGLLFPTGDFEGTWDHSELKLIERAGGRIIDITDGAWVAGSDDLADYVLTLYALRDKTKPGYNEGRAAIAKILLNSLYGKFGSAYDRESIWINPTADEIADKQLRDMCDRYRTLYLEDVFTYPDYLIPQIAAHITAVARANLWAYLWEASQGGMLYYCDTDSIISTHQYAWSFELGGMKLEKTARSGHFVAPKLYRFGDSESEEFVKAKGFGGFGAKVDSKSWRSIVKGLPFKAGRMAKLKTWAGKADTPRVHRTKKQRRTGYRKRFVYPDGSTRPWNIVDGQLT